MKRRHFIPLLLVLMSLLAACTTIDEGEVGLKVVRGNVQGEVPPGFRTFAPWFGEQIVVYSVREKTYETSAQPDQSDADYADFPVDSNTSDGQEIPLAEYTIRFHLERDCVADIYRRYGTMDQLVAKVVQEVSRSEVRNVLKEYTAEQIRGSGIRLPEADLRAIMGEELSKNCLTMSYLGLRNAELNEAYMASIEEREIAENRADSMRTSAQGAADSARIAAAGNAEATLTQAQAQAEANRLLTESITPAVIQYTWLERWDGVMPTVLGDGSGFDLLIEP